MLPSNLKCLYSVEPVRMLCSIAHSIICTVRLFRGKMHSDWFNGRETLQVRWQHGEKVGYYYPSGLEKNLFKWDIYVPLVTKGLKRELHPNCQPGGPRNVSLSGVSSLAKNYSATDLSMQLTWKVRYCSCGMYHATGLLKSVDTHSPLKYRNNNKIFTRFYAPVASATAKYFSIVKPTRCTISQICFILEQYSTCFGRSLHPSSGI